MCFIQYFLLTRLTKFSIKCFTRDNTSLITDVPSNLPRLSMSSRISFPIGSAKSSTSWKTLLRSKLHKSIVITRIVCCWLVIARQLCWESQDQGTLPLVYTQNHHKMRTQQWKHDSKKELLQLNKRLCDFPRNTYFNEWDQSLVSFDVSLEIF